MYNVVYPQAIVQDLPLKITAHHNSSCKTAIGTDKQLLTYEVVDEPLFNIQLENILSTRAVDLKILPNSQTVCINTSSDIQIANISNLSAKTTVEKDAKVCSIASIPYKQDFNIAIKEPAADLLALASRRAVKIYKVTMNSIVFLEEIPLVSTPFSLHFVTQKGLCIGSRLEVSFVNVGQSATKTQRIFSNTNQFSVISSTRPIHYTCNHSNTSSAIICTHLKSCYRVELELERSYKLLFEWSDSPEQIICQNYYILALIQRPSSRIEIRSLKTGTILQTILDIQNISYLSSGDLPYISNESNLWRLIPLDFLDQVYYIMLVNNRLRN